MIKSNIEALTSGWTRNDIASKIVTNYKLSARQNVS